MTSENELFLYTDTENVADVAKLKTNGQTRTDQQSEGRVSLQRK